MSESRAVWELYAGERLSGHALWLGGRQLLVDADDGLRALLRDWFGGRLGERTDAQVDLGFVEHFLGRVVPVRLPGFSARRVDPDSLPSGVWLAALERERLVRGQRDPSRFRSNLWPRPLTPRQLLAGTRGGRFCWARGSRGGFRAGGRTEDDEEVWLALVRDDTRFFLVTTWALELVRAPVTQRSGWLRRCELHRLWDWLDGALAKRSS